MRQTAISFKSKGAQLEGILASPQGLGGACAGVVVCHPHPHLGGSMDSPVVTALCQELVGQGLVSFRFNFRGVGESEGAFTNGDREQEDVRAALGFLRHWPQVDKGRLGLAGFSFGAAMIMSGLFSYKAAKSFVVVAPPLGSIDQSSLPKDRRPKLVLVGDQDRLVPHGVLKEKVELMGPAVKFSLVPGAAHSWRDYESQAAGTAASFFVGTLSP